MQGTAAADGVNGSITMEKVDLSMTLNAPSESSGVGAGRLDSTGCGAVCVTGSRITVTEKSGVYGQYTGAWIGGAGVSTVDIRDTVLKNSADSSNHKAKAVDGVTVNMTGCAVGEENNPVIEPLHATAALNITNCQIYQKNDYSLGDTSMLGTADGGKTTIANSTVQISYGSNGSAEALFTGQLLIGDAASDVTIAHTQVAEVGNGDIIITEDGITQTGQDPAVSVSHRHNGLSYLLLEEKGLPAAAPDVTVSGLGADKTITVQQPVQPADAAQKDVTLGSLTVSTDARLILKGNLVVKEKAAAGKAAGDGSGAGSDAQITLTVDAAAVPAAGGRYTVTYEKGLGGTGNYEQTGGGLDGKADVAVGGNMTLTDVTADCTGYKIGSNGGSAPELAADGTVAKEGTAATVTINGGSIKAAVVGAAGAQNATFTFVKTGSGSAAGSGEPVINGALVQDHYRLRYEVNGMKLELEDESKNALPTVLRTKTPYTNGTAGEVAVLDKKPANPTGEDKEQFSCWYIWDENGETRLGLLETADTLPNGLTQKALLSKDTKSSEMSGPAGDGTGTLTVYAWFKVTGTASIKKGRLFADFTNGGKTASVPENGAWTVRLSSSGTYIDGRDYQAAFTNALPAGTDLTLTAVKADGVNEYYHYTLETEAASVKFSQFTKMGTTKDAPPTLDVSAESEEIFLLSADFGEIADGAASGQDAASGQGAAGGIAPPGGEIGFSVFTREGTEPISLGDTAKVSYSVKDVVGGVITADASSVTVTTPPSGDEKRSGQKLYLAGTLKKADAVGQNPSGQNPSGEMPSGAALRVPPDAKADMEISGTKLEGQWISGDTITFELGEYGEPLVDTNYSFGFEGLQAGEYSINWRLCAGETPNITNGVCSNKAESTVTVAEEKQPKLKVTYAQGSRVLEKSREHTLSFHYETTAESFTAAVEKQLILADFSPAEGTKQTITPEFAADAKEASGTVTVQIPAEAGTWRVHFSIKDGSENDDVYFSFIVE